MKRQFKRLKKDYRGRKKGAVITIGDARKAHAKRSFRARMIDNKLKATLADSVAEWMKQPNRRDLKGVDYPRTRIQDRIKKISGVIDVVWNANNMSLAVYYNETKNVDAIKVHVANQIDKANMQTAISTINYYSVQEPHALSKYNLKRVQSARAKTSSQAELKRMTNAAVAKTQKGMDRRIAGWKLGKYRLYLLHSQIWGRYWWRIETPSGKIIKRYKGKLNLLSYEDALESLADAVERRTGNTKVANELREPKKLKRKNKQLSEGLFEAFKDSEAVKKFIKRFTFDKTPQKSSFSGGIVYSRDKAVGLVLNRDGAWKKQFKNPVFTLKAKVNSKMRATFKSKAKYGTKNILVGDDAYRGKKLWNALMVLDVKKPLTFKKAKTGILSITDAYDRTIIVAPLELGGVWGMQAEAILRSHPLSKILKTGKPWGRKQATQLLQKILKKTRKELIKKGREFSKASKTKSWLKTKMDREKAVNNDLGHSGLAETYLGLKEHIMKLQGKKVSHRELWEPYHNNHNMWKDGKLLI